MNNLSELNTYSSESTIEISNDARDPQIIVDRAQAINQSLAYNEGQSERIPLGIEIEEVVNYDQITSYYEIDVSSVTDSTVTWDVTIPSHMTLTNPSTGIYRLEGFRSVNDWLTVRNPVVAQRSTYSGIFTYTAKVGYSIGGVDTEYQWTVTVDIADIDILNIPSDLFWDISTSQSITGVPTIQEVSSDNYTMTGTASSTTTITNITSAGSGGTFNYNSGTGVFTITGNKTEVNSHLENLTLVANGNSENYSIEYTVVNDTTSEADTKTQQFKCNNIRFLSLVSTVNIPYNEDNVTAISGGPLITDLDNFAADGTYTMSITGAGVRILSAVSGIGGYTGHAVFDTPSKTLNIVGRKAEVNSYINNITLIPEADRTSDFTLTYTILTPTGDTQSKAQNILISGVHDEINGLGVQRYYAQNTASFIFNNTTYINTGGSSATLAQTTPNITDEDTISATYSYTITNTQGGEFSVDNISKSSSYTFSGGTKAQLQASLAALRFYPQKNSTVDYDITYTQRKDGVTHYTQSFTIEAVSTGGTTYQEFFQFFSTQTWNVPVDTQKYSTNKINAMLMGGGGAGGYLGGGGGGGRQNIVNYTLFSSSYPITVGSGGTPVISLSPLNTTQAAQARGGTTSAFGQSAPGGEGGSISGGGSSGTVNGSSGSVGGANYTTPADSNYHSGGGGGGAATVDDAVYRTNMRYYLGGLLNTNANWPNEGTDGNVGQGNGSEGGLGGAAVEYPIGSNDWYGGGGGGSGGIWVPPPSQANINSGFGWESLVSYPSNPFDEWGGGATGNANGKDPNTPYITGANGINGKKGGGGGGAHPAGSAGYGGPGVVVVEVI